MRLIIGNKNYSSWSLRPWLLLEQAGIAFEEVVIALYTPGSREEILQYSPAGKVPVLIDGEIAIWDSLAICEHVAETRPGLWPEARAARAHARAISAEMHSGFAELRNSMPMNCRASLPGLGRTPAVEYDIFRITSIWEDCRARYADAGPFLFGRFSIADAMYAPVVWRFNTYAVELPSAARDYADTMFALPAMQEWLTAARTEPQIIPQCELEPPLQQ